MMEREEFVKYMENIYCGAMMNVCLTFGHELGIFDVLFDATEPVSLQLIAERKGLKERYTKELLSSFVAAKLIHQDKETYCYSIPDAYKQEFKGMLGIIPGMAVYFKRADRTMECFRKEGPYGFECNDSDWFEWFHSIRVKSLDHHLENEFVPFFSKVGLIAKLEAGIKVLDIGCGSASFTTALAQKFPNSNFTGLDMSTNGLKLAKETVDKSSLANVQLIEGDCHTLQSHITCQHDMVFMYDTLHEMHDPNKVLEQVYEALKDDGSLVIFELGFHSNPVENVGDMAAAFIYGNSLLHCLPSAMQREPHIGYGACWGMEEIESTLVDAKFKVTGRDFDNKLFAPSAAFHCTK